VPFTFFLSVFRHIHLVLSVNDLVQLPLAHFFRWFVVAFFKVAHCHSTYISNISWSLSRVQLCSLISVARCHPANLPALVWRYCTALLRATQFRSANSVVVSCEFITVLQFLEPRSIPAVAGLVWGQSAAFRRPTQHSTSQLTANIACFVRGLCAAFRRATQSQAVTPLKVVSVGTFPLRDRRVSRWF
jgi:hypothetical protein